MAVVPNDRLTKLATCPLLAVEAKKGVSRQSLGRNRAVTHKEKRPSLSTGALQCDIPA